MITLAAAKPGDEERIADLLGELDLFYGDTPRGTGGERPRRPGPPGDGGDSFRAAAAIRPVLDEYLAGR